MEALATDEIFEIFARAQPPCVDYIELALALGALFLAQHLAAVGGTGAVGGAVPPRFARCIFDMMDLSGDGYITRGELHSALGMLLASNGAAPRAHDAMDVRGEHGVPAQNDAAAGAANESESSAGFIGHEFESSDMGMDYAFFSATTDKEVEFDRVSFEEFDRVFERCWVQRNAAAVSWAIHFG
jgi:hypothetical protein